MSQEENLLKLEKQAIKAALNENWSQAIEINQKILDINPNNTPALNRLGMALFKQGKKAVAKKYFNQVLKIDSSNSIAVKNLEKLRESGKTPKDNQYKFSTASFIEEPGKTKLVKLVRLGSPQDLLQLNSGQEVLLVPKKRMVSVTDNRNTYLGALPEDLSIHLSVLISGGNKYQAFVKSADKQSLQLFIRETERAARFLNQPSFNTNGSSAPVAFLPEREKRGKMEMPLEIDFEGED